MPCICNYQFVPSRYSLRTRAEHAATTAQHCTALRLLALRLLVLLAAGSLGFQAILVDAHLYVCVWPCWPHHHLSGLRTNSGWGLLGAPPGGGAVHPSGLFGWGVGSCKAASSLVGVIAHSMYFWPGLCMCVRVRVCVHSALRVRA